MSLRYPPALDLGFARLQEKLQDPDTGVVSATVNVLCELARKDPERFLPLAPQLFQLLTTSSNNWMLIKIIKLVCIQTPPFSLFDDGGLTRTCGKSSLVQ